MTFQFGGGGAKNASVGYVEGVASKTCANFYSFFLYLTMLYNDVLLCIASYQYDACVASCVLSYVTRVRLCDVVEIYVKFFLLKCASCVSLRVQVLSFHIG